MGRYVLCVLQTYSNNFLIYMATLLLCSIVVLIFNIKGVLGYISNIGFIFTFSISIVMSIYRCMRINYFIDKNLNFAIDFVTIIASIMNNEQIKDNEFKNAIDKINSIVKSKDKNEYSNNLVLLALIVNTRDSLRKMFVEKKYYERDDFFGFLYDKNINKEEKEYMTKCIYLFMKLYYTWYLLSINMDYFNYIKSLIFKNSNPVDPRRIASFRNHCKEIWILDSEYNNVEHDLGFNFEFDIEKIKEV